MFGRTQLSSRQGVFSEFIDFLKAQNDAKLNIIVKEFEDSARKPHIKIEDEHTSENWKEEKEKYKFDLEKYTRAKKKYHKLRYLNKYDRVRPGESVKSTPREVWKKYANELQPYVKKFSLNKYYTEPIARAKKEMPHYKILWDLIEGSETLREVYYSTSVQHGHNKINVRMIEAYQDVFGKNKAKHIQRHEINEAVVIPKLIEAIYNHRRKISKSDRDRERFDREEPLAFKMFAFESATKN